MAAREMKAVYGVIELSIEAESSRTLSLIQ